MSWGNCRAQPWTAEFRNFKVHRDLRSHQSIPAGRLLELQELMEATPIQLSFVESTTGPRALDLAVGARQTQPTWPREWQHLSEGRKLWGVREEPEAILGSDVKEVLVGLLQGS
jgi:hypothetical protein